MSFAGKVALVTGSGRGIGRAIALGFARNGGNVIINAIHSENVYRVVKEVEALGAGAVPAVADVSNQKGVDQLFDIVSRKFGKLDILVNNAGINIVKPAFDFTEEEWDKVNAVNLKSTFLCSRAAAKLMIPQGWGRVINISSVLGINPFPLRAPYSTTKAGVIMLTRELATEWAKHNIQLNAIAPGFFQTDMFMDRVKEGTINQEALLKRVPMGRFGDVQEIVNLVLFLASEQSSYITGQVIAIDGGYTAYGFPE